MPKVCDNTSVAILVWRDSKLLMIERKKYNFGFAVPAGHQDGLDPVQTANSELGEEIGLTPDALEQKLELALPNTCKRDGGTHHLWTVFEATTWHGEIKPSQDETKSFIWADREALLKMVAVLEEFSKRKGIALDTAHVAELQRATNEDKSWIAQPGLEPPMFFLFKRLGII